MMRRISWRLEAALREVVVVIPRFESVTVEAWESLLQGLS